MYDRVLLIQSRSCYYAFGSTPQFHEITGNSASFVRNGNGNGNRNGQPLLLPKSRKFPIFKNQIKAKATSSVGDVDSGEYSNYLLYQKKQARGKGSKAAKQENGHLNGFAGIQDSDDAVEFLEFSSKTPEQDVGKLSKEEEVPSIQGLQKETAEASEIIKSRSKSARNTIRRSNILAKQVIIVESALSLGFVSQLWVDVNSWNVLVIEVRPNLLSGELERILLQDVKQVGDVILIEDESVVRNEFKLVGLETLVGYNVVTPARRRIGKVRGFSFNVDTGAVELLEIDAFGISIIPSSLVSTYALFIEDVLEVGADTVVVHEAAASHIQRLTKGLWDTQNTAKSFDEFDDYSEYRRRRAQPDFSTGQNKNFSSKKFRQKVTGAADEWELPMDYL